MAVQLSESQAMINELQDRLAASSQRLEHVTKASGVVGGGGEAWGGRQLQRPTELAEVGGRFSVGPQPPPSLPPHLTLLASGP